MRAQTLVIEKDNVSNGAESILFTDAMHRFSAASARLEQHHAELQQKITSLTEQLHAKDLEIERAARLATLGETAAAIAHEVRNPLGAIKLFLSLLRDDVKDAPSSLKLVDQINTGIVSIDHVVSNILHFAKDGNATLAPVNLHSIVQDQVSQLKTLHKDKAQISMSLTGSPFISGDEHSLRQVIYNLLLNSLQATKFLGPISISACDSINRELVMTVHDGGRGIPESILPKLFEPFVTSRNEGTGLGLAIVKKIVSQHRGTIEACNQGGALFTVTFPRK